MLLRVVAAEFDVVTSVNYEFWRAGVGDDEPVVHVPVFVGRWGTAPGAPCAFQPLSVHPSVPNRVLAQGNSWGDFNPATGGHE